MHAIYNKELSLKELCKMNTGVNCKKRRKFHIAPKLYIAANLMFHIYFYVLHLYDVWKLIFCLCVVGVIFAGWYHIHIFSFSINVEPLCRLKDGHELNEPGTFFYNKIKHLNIYADISMRLLGNWLLNETSGYEENILKRIQRPFT